MSNIGHQIFKYNLILEYHETHTGFGRKTFCYFVIKAGGDVLDSNTTIIDDINMLTERGAKVVFVYGAQSELNEKMAEYGMIPEFKNGLRVTSADVMENVYIPVMQAKGHELARQIKNAELLIGAVRAKKICGLGYVGEATHVNSSVKSTLDNGRVAVVSPLAVSDKNWEGYGIEEYLNCNADSVAGKLAAYLKPDGVYFATNVNGVMMDGLLIPALDAVSMQSLVSEGIATGGMAQKIRYAAVVAQKGVDAVIFNGMSSHSLPLAILEKTGTLVYKPFT